MAHFFKKNCAARFGRQINFFLQLSCTILFGLLVFSINYSEN